MFFFPSSTYPPNTNFHSALQLLIFFYSLHPINVPYVDPSNTKRPHNIYPPFVPTSVCPYTGFLYARIRHVYLVRSCPFSVFSLPVTIAVAVAAVVAAAVADSANQGAGSFRAYPSA